jgi:hypothetical protein
MGTNRFDLWQLAARIQNGDTTATGVFLSELERQISRMIRRQVRLGSTRSEVDLRIAAEMGQLLGEYPHAFSVDRDELIQKATQRICRATLEAVRSNRYALETIIDL